MQASHPDVAPLTNEVFREIFQSMSEGTIMVNSDGLIVAANPVAEQLFGYSVAEMAGMPLEQLLPERYRKGHFSFRKGFNANPQPRRMGEGRDLTALRKEGTEFPVEISLSFTRIKGDLLVMAFISDISLRKKAEDALKKSEEQLSRYAFELEKKVALRTQALNDSIINLEREIQERRRAEEDARRSLEKERDLNELKSKFVSIASHEFRTPLSSILSSVSLIKSYADKADLAKVDKHVQRVKSSVSQLTGILNDFLSLGKLEEGKMDVVFEDIDPDSFVHEVDEEIKGVLKEGLKLNVYCELRGVPLRTDGRILKNILFNLISNASKYSDADKQIYVSCRQADSSVLFEVRDEGIGIPDEDQKFMFDRFFRAKNAGNVQGTGLGLNIVKRYVDLLNGRVEFRSQHHVGTTFTVTLPVVS